VHYQLGAGISSGDGRQASILSGNDLDDVPVLAIAVAYCDVVVIEKSWAPCTLGAWQALKSRVVAASGEPSRSSGAIV